MNRHTDQNEVWLNVFDKVSLPLPSFIEFVLRTWTTSGLSFVIVQSLHSSHFPPLLSSILESKKKCEECSGWTKGEVWPPCVLCAAQNPIHDGDVWCNFDSNVPISRNLSLLQSIRFPPLSSPSWLHIYRPLAHIRTSPAILYSRNSSEFPFGQFRIGGIRFYFFRPNWPPPTSREGGKYLTIWIIFSINFPGSLFHPRIMTDLLLGPVPPRDVYEQDLYKGESVLHMAIAHYDRGALWWGGGFGTERPHSRLFITHLKDGRFPSRGVDFYLKDR